MKIAHQQLAHQVVKNNFSSDLLRNVEVSEKKSDVSFIQRLEAGINEVSKAQNEAANLAQNYELGTENDLTKVMVGQQVSSLAFQLTLNVRNKALSAYKDIMNMPV